MARDIAIMCNLEIDEQPELTARIVLVLRCLVYKPRMYLGKSSSRNSDLRAILRRRFEMNVSATYRPASRISQSPAMRVRSLHDVLISIGFKTTTSCKSRIVSFTL